MQYRSCTEDPKTVNKGYIYRLLHAQTEIHCGVILFFLKSKTHSFVGIGMLSLSLAAVHTGTTSVICRLRRHAPPERSPGRCCAGGSCGSSPCPSSESRRCAEERSTGVPPSSGAPAVRVAARTPRSYICCPCDFFGFNIKNKSLKC